MKHAISNECLSLQHIVQSPGPRGCLKSGILPSLCNVIFVIVSNDMVWTRRGLCVLSEAPLIIIIHLRRKCVEHTNSKSCLSLQHNTSFPVRRGCLKSNILPEIQYFVDHEEVDAGAKKTKRFYSFQKHDCATAQP